MPRCGRCNMVYIGSSECPHCTPMEEIPDDISLQGMGWDSDPIIDLPKELDEIKKKPSYRIEGDLVMGKKVMGDEVHDHRVSISDSIINRSTVGANEGPNTGELRDSLINRSNLTPSKETLKTMLEEEIEDSEAPSLSELPNHSSLDLIPEPHSDDHSNPASGPTGLCPSCGHPVDMESEYACANCGKFL